MDPTLRPAHVVELYRALAEANGVPDDVWCFPASVFTRARAPLDYIEVAAWDQREAPASPPWTAFVTIGMSGAPLALLPTQTPCELMICLPVEVKPEATHRVAMWLAVAAFQPFTTGRPYRVGDRITLGGGHPDVPELEGYQALVLEDVSGDEPFIIGETKVSILGLSPE